MNFETIKCELTRHPFKLYSRTRDMVSFNKRFQNWYFTERKCRCGERREDSGFSKVWTILPSYGEPLVLEQPAKFLMHIILFGDLKRIYENHHLWTWSDWIELAGSISETES